MRFLMKVKMDTAAFNEVARRGEAGKLMQTVMEGLKPEAAYFGTEDGKRTGFFIVNMDDASQLPSLAEPFFLALGAAIEVQPVMTPADLAKAGGVIDAAAKKFG